MSKLSLAKAQIILQKQLLTAEEKVRSLQEAMAILKTAETHIKYGAHCEMCGRGKATQEDQDAAALRFAIDND